MPRVSEAKRARMDKMLSADKEDVYKWTEALGSESTRHVWPRRLAAFCVEVGKTPGELIQIASQSNERGQRVGLRDLLADYERHERKRGKQGSTVAFAVKVVKSWLSFNGVQIPRGLVRVRDADKVYSEAALTKEELRRVLHAANRRERAAVGLMAFSGFRPMVLGNYDGSDGLRVGDVVDLEIDNTTRYVSFKKTPARIVVRQELSKAKHVYFSFLSEEGCEYLAEYLNLRLRPNADWKKGEKVTADSPLIIPERARRNFIVTTNIGDLVRSAIRKAGLTARPYSMRTTFATRLLSAEAEGEVPHSVAQFFMGHRGDMTARYAQNRGQLPPEVIEQMRAAYKRCEPFLSTVPTAAGRDEAAVKIKRLLLKVAGYSDGELAKVEVGELADDQIEKMVSDRVGRAAGLPTQQVVRTAQVESLLSQGFEVVTSLGSDQVVLRMPNGNGHHLSVG